jgi:hypothetical protein
MDQSKILEPMEGPKISITKTASFPRGFLHDRMLQKGPTLVLTTSSVLGNKDTRLRFTY